MITNFAEESELLSLFPINKDNDSGIINNSYSSSEGERFDYNRNYLGNNISQAIDTHLLNNEKKTLIDETLLLESLENTPDINKEKDGDKDILTGEIREMSRLENDSLLGGNSDDLASVIAPVKPKKQKQKSKKEDDIVEEIPFIGDDVLIPNSSAIQRRSHDDSNLTLEVASSSDSDINTIIGYPKWNLNYLGNQITYGFVVAGGDGYDREPLEQYGNKALYPLSSSGKNMVRKVFNDLEKYIPVDFVETSYSYDNPPLMVIMGVETEKDVSFAYYPDNNRTAGDVFLDNDAQNFYSVVAHEIGHALGLKHGVYGDPGDKGPFLPPSKANLDVTVMGRNLGPSGKYPTEYRPLDIKALQYLYGRNESQEITPEISISNVTITEGNRGTKKAKFKVTLDQADDEIVKVNYSTSNGSAKAGSDYRSRQGTLTFKPGQKTKTINIPIIGDRKVESNETFFVTLNSPTNAEIVDGSGKGTIKNNDKKSSSKPSISITNVNIVEGDYGTKNATFKVRLNKASNSRVKVDYQTVEDTSFFAAVPGFDYKSKSGTITFKPRQKTKKIKIPVYGDNWYEFDHGFWVYLDNPRSAKIKDAWGFANIIDDD